MIGIGHQPSHTRSFGFTIVELLIVIVVIGILAAITFVAYNGIQNRAKTSVLQQDISTAVRSIEAAKAGSSNERYPSSATEASLRASGSTTLSYFYDPLTNQYCIEGVSDSLRFIATSANTSSRAGKCNEQGLIGWWLFNNSLNDQGSLGLSTTTSAATFGTGQNGAANSAAVFNGSSSGVSYGSNAALHPESMTIALWVRPSTWSTSEATTSLVSKRSGSSNGFFLHKMNIGGTGTLSFDVGPSSARWTTGYTPPAGQWTHLVLTASSAGRNLYVNGALQGTIPSSSLPNAIIQSTFDLKLGIDSSNAYRYTGSLDDVRLYNRVVGAEEAASLYSQGAQ
jgi:prepilin-type N-terminal cleavage/methylation domain-containing protein